MGNIKAIAMHLDDTIGGMRQLVTITDISLSDNGSAEAVYNTVQELIGFNSAEGGYSLSTTVQYVKDNPFEPDYWHLRSSREEVNITLDFGGGDRVQFRGVLATFEPKAGNDGKVTADVKWTMGEPKVLDKGNGPNA